MCACAGADTRFLIVSSSIFISYSSRDQKVAETICDALQSRGYPCWISCRDVGPGENFQESIVKAIRAAKLMLLVFTSNANNSNEIKKEIVLAGRYHLTVVPVRVEDVVPNDALAYEFATRQWIDLFRDWDRDIERLASQIGSILGEGLPNGDKGATIIENLLPQSSVGKKSPLRRLVLLSFPLIALALGGAYLYWRPAALPLLSTSAAPASSAEDRAWSNAGTVDSLRQYLEGFPNGVHAPEAQQRIRLIDDKTWANALATGTIVALNRYLSLFPDGVHVAQAQRSIAGLERQASDQDHSSEGTRFDGSWMATISCLGSRGLQSYTIQITAQVKDGMFHGQRGTEGEPDSLTVDGPIQLDGSAELFAQGVTVFAVGTLPAGAKYTYHIMARFEGAGATGTRVESRPCSFAAAKH
jgi:hypothetical protein